MSCSFRKPTVLSKNNEPIEQVFKMMSFGTNARSQPCLPLINGLVDDGLLQLGPNRRSLLQVVDVPHLCLINAFLYQSPYCSRRRPQSGEFVKCVKKTTSLFLLLRKNFRFNETCSWHSIVIYVKHEILFHTVM